jgi:hypothetical protein
MAKITHLMLERGAALEHGLQAFLVLDVLAEVLQLGVLLVELDGVGEGVGVVEGVRKVDLRDLVLLDGLDHPRQLHHYLLHALQ